MNWPQAEIREVGKVVSGATPKTSVERFWNGDTPWVTPKDLSNLDAKLLADTPRKITKEGLKSCSTVMLPAQSVLFSCRAPIGLVAINSISVCTNQGFKSIVPDRSKIVPDYLYWWLKIHRPKLEALGRGATFKEVSKQIVERVQIPLPPLQEQKRIAAILDAADDLRTKRRESLAQLDALLQSTFLDLFGDSEGKFPNHSVADLLAEREKPGPIRTGPFGSKLKHSEFVDQGIAVLGIDNTKGNQFTWKQRRYITPEKYEGLRRYKVFPGDVIITIMGTIGRCAIVPPDIPEAINTKHLCCISLDFEKCLPEYLHAAFLQHPKVLHQLGMRQKGAIMAGLNQTIISALQIPVPPLGLQQHFADIVKLVERQKALLRAHLTELDTLFASIHSRAFRGEL